MADLNQIYKLIQPLPYPDQLQLVERIVHDLASSAQPDTAPRAKPSLLGLFADDPELVDDMCDSAMRDRSTRPWRTVNE